MCTNFTADVISMNTKLCSAMKTICPPGYYNNGLVTTNAHGHMKYGGAYYVPKCMSYRGVIVVITVKKYGFQSFIYTLILFRQGLSTVCLNHINDTTIYRITSFRVNR